MFSLEWKNYKLVGKYPETNRNRTIIIPAVSQEHAEAAAINMHGLVPPFIVTSENLPAPSE